MPPPTREQVNALIERRKPLGFFTVPDCLEAVAALTALQAENDRLRAQASPAWVALSERKPTREDADRRGAVLQWLDSGAVVACGWSDLSAVTHWQRLPAPPESAADRQRREDEEAFQNFMANGACEIDRRIWTAALAHARKEATP